MTLTVGPSELIVGRSRLRPASPLYALASAFIVVWVVIAVLAPLLAPQRPDTVNLGYAFVGPSSQHLLGADGSGRDLLSRLMWGARSALLGPLVVVAIAGTIAVAVALIAALVRGWFDLVASRVLDVIFAFPGILLALVGVAIFGPGLTSAVGALSIAYIPYIARVIRGDALRNTSQLYIQAARLNGVSGRSIVVRHLLPNLRPLIIGQLTLSFGYAMVDLVAISFLGLGVQEPSADWGLMVQEGQAGILRGYPQESLLAGVAIVLVVVSFTVVGDHLISRSRSGSR